MDEGIFCPGLKRWPPNTGVFHWLLESSAVPADQYRDEQYQCWALICVVQEQVVKWGVGDEAVAAVVDTDAACAVAVVVKVLWEVSKVPRALSLVLIAEFGQRLVVCNRWKIQMRKKIVLKEVLLWPVLMMFSLLQ